MVGGAMCIKKKSAAQEKIDAEERQPRYGNERDCSRFSHFFAAFGTEGASTRTLWACHL